MMRQPGEFSGKNLLQIFCFMSYLKSRDNLWLIYLTDI